MPQCRPGLLGCYLANLALDEEGDVEEGLTALVEADGAWRLVGHYVSGDDDSETRAVLL